MSTSATTGAALTWPKTNLGVIFAAYLVQRFHPTSFNDKVPGWRSIARLTNENRLTWTDVEARRNTSEIYRILDLDIYGGLSQYSAQAAVTVPGAMTAVTSNEDPTLNQDLSLRFPIDVKTPEDRFVTSGAGRTGHRMFRSTTRRGTEFNPTVFLRRSNVPSPLRGPAMWEPLIDKFREDISYLCILLPTGQRYFVGAQVDGLKWNCNVEVDVPVSFVDLGNTPSVPVITT